jgi:hypothetical protein
MPYRLDPEKYGEFRAKIQFTTAAWMPWEIYQACLATGTVSNTRYCQLAVCEKLARDLDMDLDSLIEKLPKPRSSAAHLWDPSTELTGVKPPTPRRRIAFGDNTGGSVRIGPYNTIEEID